MKKVVIFILLFVLVFALNFSSASAINFSTGKFFGGRIVSPKAIEIQLLENAGFVCPVIGTSFSIWPIGSPPGTPKSYFIPSFIRSSTGTIIRGIGQLIIGRYIGPTYISCVHSVTGVVKNVSLETVDLYGTSR